MSTRAFLLVLLALPVGCASPAAPRPNPELARVIERAAAQVKRCYRAPRVGPGGHEIVTRLLVRYATDGTLADLPIVVAQAGVTPENRPYADVMAQAAARAVMSCAPLSLPPESYADGWDHFELTFSPSALA